MSRKEAQTAAAYLGASWYDSIANDLEVTYDLDFVRKVAAVIRQVAPDIILIPALLDYMEDHMNTARIVVTAAFAKGMPNFHTIPQVDPIQKEIALYHALPYGLHDGLGRDSGQFSFAEGWIRHNSLGYRALPILNRLSRSSTLLS